MQGISARIVEAGYSLRHPILKNIELTIDSGEKVLLVGASGSGKTTLFLTITGVIVNLLEGYVRGHVSLQNVNPLSPEGFLNVPRLVGVILQDPEKQLSMPTPYDEVAFTLESLGMPEEAINSRVRVMLERFNLVDRIFDDVSSLSGGQLRRLTFAAALAHEPPILLLDEPTASLDPWGVREVRRTILEESGRTIVIIEHKARFFFDIVDKVIAIKNGTVAGVWGREDLDPSALGRLGADVLEPHVREVREGEGELLLCLRGAGLALSGRRILSDIDLEVRRGDMIALIGPNGSGKTSLLRLIAGIYRPSWGERCVKESVRPFYTPQLPDYTFMFNQVRRELEYSARRGGSSVEEAFRLAPWLRAVLERSPYTLSHGQRRWLSIVIAGLHGANLLLLDEPSTGLDVELYGKLCSMITAWREKGAVVFATHDSRLVAECANRAIIVENGKAREVSREQAVRLMEEAWRI